MSSKAQQSSRKRESSSQRDLWTWALPAAFVVVLALVVVGAIAGSKGDKSTPGDHKPSGDLAGDVAPAFSVMDAVSGNTLTNADYGGKNLLLFFSEGVMCQACMVQIVKLEQEKKQFDRRNMALAHVSTDTVDQLRQAAQEYKIKSTPLLADPDRKMSTDYNMLGKGGMGHPTQDGHAFMLVGPKGKILWEQAYTSMFVKPDKLFGDMPKVR